MVKLEMVFVFVGTKLGLVIGCRFVFSFLLLLFAASVFLLFVQCSFLFLGRSSIQVETLNFEIGIVDGESRLEI